jgi:site-specific recombinase XerD
VLPSTPVFGGMSTVGSLCLVGAFSSAYAQVNKGTDIRTVQGYLGHRAISSTGRYTSLDSKRLAKLF